MRLNLQRIDRDLPLPAYQTPGAAGFDLYARVRVEVDPGQTALIPSNVIVDLPAGYALLVALRSSTPIRKGLISPHGIGIVDSDYCGPEDELKTLVFNPSGRPIVVERGERIAQALVVEAGQVELTEVEKIDAPTRGGFGSTGA